MSAAFIVVVGEAHYGPFPSRDAAHEWTSHPDRTTEASFGYRVVPLFGGLFLDPLPGEPATHQIDDVVYPGQFGLPPRFAWAGTGFDADLGETDLDRIEREIEREERAS